MRFPLAHFERFCGQLVIPSKDQASTFRMTTLFETQRYFLQEIATGLEQDVHDFLALKGRQEGITTITDALSLYWPQKFAGIQGMAVADDDSNLKVRRDILRQMLYSLSPEWRQEIVVDNEELLRFKEGGRLMYAAAAVRTSGTKTKLGRGRGVNYVQGDEFDAWTNQRAVKGFRASLSDRHPNRLSCWASTAQGHGVLEEAWKAKDSPTTRKIFIGAWRHSLNRVDQSNRAIWDAYGREEPTDDERLWLHAIRERYGVEVPPEYVVWRRWKLATDMLGDEDMMAQEHPNLPEDAFVSFGDKFFRPAVVRQLRSILPTTPAPKGFTHAWGPMLDETRVEECSPDDATLRVWEEPHPAGVYLVACHPAYSSTPTARDDVIQVWRCYPDLMVQVAEWAIEGGGPTYQVAWVAMHLAGAYRQNRRTADIYFILELQMTGQAVLLEIQRIENLGYGMTSRIKEAGREIQDLVGSLRAYCFIRPDTFTGTPAQQWRTSPNLRPWLLNQLRDEVERRHLDIRSEELIDEMAIVRRGEQGDGDVIQGGGTSTDCRVIAAALAVEMYLKQVLPDIEYLIAPKTPSEKPQTVLNVQVRSFLHQLATTGRTR